MVNTAITDHEVNSQITVSLTDGTQKKFSQVMQDTAQGFSLTSDAGDGGGYYLGDGLCLGYIGTEDGHGYAMTIVLDGPSAERLLRTELQDGKAVRIFREKYLKIN